MATEKNKIVEQREKEESYMGQGDHRRLLVSLTFNKFEDISELCDGSPAWRKSIASWGNDVCNDPEAKLCLAYLLNCEEESDGGWGMDTEFRALREEARDQIT